MQAACSFAAGICVFVGSAGRLPMVVRMDLEPPVVDSHLPPWLNLMDDWQNVHGDTQDEIIKHVLRAYLNHRCSSYFESCIAGVTDGLRRDLIEEIEAELQAHANSRAVVQNLLKAPLANPPALRTVCDIALANGYGATAAVANDVLEYQPHIRRFAHAWSQTVASVYQEREADVSALYAKILQHPQYLDLLTAASRNVLSNVFLSLARAESDPTSRSACFAASRSLANALFGDNEQTAASLTDIARLDAEEYPTISNNATAQSAPHIAYESSLRQVRAIVDAVSAGQDARADEYLRDLLFSQTSLPGTADYAVKSLCNIAKQCADLFRIDFERRCLDEALKLAPDDSWTLVQLADHMKRSGDYHAALAAADRALDAGGGDVALSSKADILAQRGDFEASLAIYRSIANWELLPEVRTAVADLIRRSGDLDNAEVEYERLEAAGMHSDRVVAGKAEIAKRRGNLALAGSLYESLLGFYDLSEKSRSIYRAAFSGILKQQGRYREAFDVAQQLVIELPFFLPARVLRGSILGLLNREAEGLADIPVASRPLAFGEWWRNYTRGLLLLRMGDFSQARSQLLDNLEAAVAADDERVVRKLAAALYFIMSDECVKASGLLATDLHSHDEYIDYILSVLRLHVAVAARDEERTLSILAAIEERGYGDPLLAKAVVLIRLGDLKAAQSIELDALLRLAA